MPGRHIPVWDGAGILYRDWDGQEEGMKDYSELPDGDNSLSDEEILDLANDFSGMTYEDLDVVAFARALLAKYRAPTAQQDASAAQAVPDGYVLLPTELAERVSGALNRLIADESWTRFDMDTYDDFTALTTQPSGQVQQPACASENLIERLKLHCEDKRNTAFSRSSMREALQYLTASAPAAAPNEAISFALSVFDDVLGDIADWEDKSLAAAVKEAQARLRTIAATDAPKGEPSDEFRAGVKAAADMLFYMGANTDDDKWASSLNSLAEDVLELSPEDKVQWKSIGKAWQEGVEHGRESAPVDAAAIRNAALRQAFDICMHSDYLADACNKIQNLMADQQEKGNG